MSSEIRMLDRALGALYGLAIGDALGMPVQDFEAARAAETLGSPPDFRAADLDHPIAHGLAAGTITDDTMQCVLVARLLIDGGGHISPRAFADVLLAWERDMIRRGRADLLGPSTKRALEALEAGADPSAAGSRGTTNGAAMRITPIGIATRPSRLIQAVVDADRVTHDTRIAHAGAAAVAAVVSAGVEGMSFDQAAPEGIAAAAHFGFGDLFRQPDRLATGVETAESVPTAFAIAGRHSTDAWEACVAAASLGGDTDTIAALAGAMVGACNGLRALPDRAVRKVRDVNNLDFEPLGRELLALRRR